MPDEPSLGEAHRRIDRLEVRLDTRTVSLNTYRAEREADRARVADLEQDLAKMSERLTWAWRAALTGVLLPIILTVALLVLVGRPTP